MEKYKKPRCNCGSCLQVYERVIYDQRVSISKTGEVNVVKYRSIYEYDNDARKLECPKCSLSYKYDEDDEGRIIKGEIE